jgi:hypothetical protein
MYMGLYSMRYINWTTKEAHVHVSTGFKIWKRIVLIWKWLLIIFTLHYFLTLDLRKIVLYYRFISEHRT